MMRRNLLVLLIGLALLTLAATVFSAAQKKAQNATITCDGKAVYNWKTNTLDFTKGCKVEVKGPDKSVMTSERISAKFDQGGTRVKEVVASGPVQFDVTISPDAEGVTRHISARCKGDALFTGADSIIRLTGGAEAVMTTSPAQPDSEPAKFTGDTVVVNLQTSEVTVEGGVHFQVDIPGQPAQ